MKKKCTNCGSTNLQPIERHDMVFNGFETYAYLNCEQFVCVDCGHIELYAPENGLIRKKAKEAIEKEISLKPLYDELDKGLSDVKKQLDSASKKLPIIESKISKLEDMANDENLTVKEHNNSLKELDEAKTELHDIESLITKCEYFISHKYDEIKANIHKNGHR